MTVSSRQRGRASPEAMLRNVFGRPPRRYTGARAGYADHAMERCAVGRLPTGGFELAFDPKRLTYMVTVVRAHVGVDGSITYRHDPERTRTFGVAFVSDPALRQAQKDAWQYIRRLGGTIPRAIRT